MGWRWRNWRTFDIQWIESIKIVWSLQNIQNKKKYIYILNTQLIKSYKIVWSLPNGGGIWKKNCTNAKQIDKRLSLEK